ncbi:hypothetical protein [Dinoroseobacter sp. S124A]|uniref:hypothetical protein n=1 Tax=Dinoroseobacter sp. S124A TaxID=3415128 RepID=UPI003C7C5E97
MAITDEDSARAWLETQTDQQVRTALAARAALRATPAIGEEFGEALAWVALPVLRAVITASVAAVVLPGRTAQTLKTSSVQAAEIAKEAAESAYSEANSAARCSSHAAFTASGSNTLSSASSAIKYSTVASYFDQKTYRENRSVVYSACDWDADYLTSNRKDEPTSKSIFYRPLWPSEAFRDFPTGEPLGLVQHYAKLTEFFDGNPDTWGFWKRWLEGMRTGDPMDWSLQEQIALIGSTDEDRFSVWEGENAPQRIAGKIEFIEARYEAAKANKRLQAALAKATQSRFEVGGNFPPEPLEGVSTSVPSAIFKSLTEATATLSEELEKEAPDKEELEKSASSLRDALRKCRTYLAKTADNAAQKAVGTAAVSGSAELISWISAKQSLIGALLDALQRLLPLVS